jgi:hypothetical protein
MAKNVSTVFKFQGTLGEYTHVNSMTYEPHVRAKRGTYTPIKLNKSMKKCSDMLMNCNGQAKLIFDALRDEYRDGSLWWRMVSIFFKRAKDGLKPSVQMLNKLECNAKCKLHDLLGKEYTVEVERAAKSMRLRIALPAGPLKGGIEKMSHYRLHVVVLYPNFSKGVVRKEIAAGEVMPLSGEPVLLDLELPAPSATAPYLLLQGITGYVCVNDTIHRIWTYRGLAVVKTS